MTFVSWKYPRYSELQDAFSGRYSNIELTDAFAGDRFFSESIFVGTDTNETAGCIHTFLIDSTSLCVGTQSVLLDNV